MTVAPFYPANPASLVTEGSCAGFRVAETVRTSKQPAGFTPALPMVDSDLCQETSFPGAWMGILGSPGSWNPWGSGHGGGGAKPAPTRRAPGTPHTRAFERDVVGGGCKASTNAQGPRHAALLSVCTGHGRSGVQNQHECTGPRHTACLSISMHFCALS